MKKYDKSRYVATRMVRTYPPAYVKKAITAIAYLKDRSISDISSHALQDYIDRLGESERQRLIEIYESMSTDARKKPKGAKNGY